MTDRKRRIALGLSVLALVSALYSWGIFWWPFAALRVPNYYQDASALMLFVDFIRIVYLVAPIFAFVAAFRGSRWVSVGLIVFAVVSWIFGVASIPFVAFAFPPVDPRAIAITVINLVVIALAMWLLQGRSNLVFNRKALRDSG